MNLSQLKKKADKIFSEYVRRRDADENGIVRCCTCGTLNHWKKVDCGHFISRRILSVRYEEANTGPQCKRCNIFNQGEQVKFGEYLYKKHGSALDKIRIKQNNIVKDARLLFLSVIDIYSRKLEN